MSFVELKDVRKAYGAVEVLHGLNADIQEGEFIAILGESGCGKSTLLRTIAGLEEISSGQICIGGKVVNDISPRDRNIAMVFQSYALYPHMTVAQNICFPLQLSGASDAEQKTQLHRAAEMLDLTAYLDRKPRDLSGGQRQRVAMGRAIVRNPSVFLFDEPLSNLDAKLRVQMRSDIRTLQQELGTTAIYVTHDQIEAMTMADRIMLMNKGKIEQFGNPLQLYDQPASKFVAGFVGSPPINLIPGKIASVPNAVFECDSLRIAMPGTPLANGEATLGIRPEDISFCSDSAATNAQGQVESMECTGDRTVVDISIAGTKIKVSSPQRVGFDKGATVNLSFQPEKCHFFGPDGLRVRL
ncbi:ABC transporter ATP-binding protein [Pelagimonas varians]|uniref:Maltose/maltodextrin import ATP-binding protein MalK n=1 Tax=Pelagimonas varians TaxID=696760 RepID=A0A238KSE1_9RHOB|nr:sn-glycerol-3-phosphate ABC transporter ATP-binding protein UgpC [Pelagimonas varians]PYG32515.1 carbohydrate ABC transporter ATP-binding protein (CUT1 family) [Pelagimonas varians]SMX45764.1 Maltose/maltodextrin import ATP-binding protein MalK [Pelagimonas varians]